jgi:Fe2+ transport system protein FeoA
MRRRDIIRAIYSTALALPFAAAAAQPGKVWRIGNVHNVTPEQAEPRAQALEQRLADLGYVQGRNIVLSHTNLQNSDMIFRGLFVVPAKAGTQGPHAEGLIHGPGCPLSRA